MVPAFKSETLITDVYSMNPPEDRGYYFCHPIQVIRKQKFGTSTIIHVDQRFVNKRSIRL
jgi:hypothetical protein